MTSADLPQGVRFADEKSFGVSDDDNLDSVGRASHSGDSVSSSSHKSQEITSRHRFNMAARRGLYVANMAKSIRRDVSGNRVRSLEVHEACLSSPSLWELRRIFDSVQKEERDKGHRSNICSYRDPETGRMPLHCIALNHGLVLLSDGGSEQSSAMVENFVFRHLIPAHPRAIVEEDVKGRIPFTEVIITWVKTRRAERRKHIRLFGRQGSGSDALHKQDMVVSTTSDSNEMQESDDEEDEIFHSWYQADRDMNGIPPMVEWSLVMLSHILKKPSWLGRSATVDANEHCRDWGEPSSPFSDIDAAITSFHGDAVIQKVSSIPHLIEEILLTTDRDARDRVFNLHVIRRALLCRSSFGNGHWFKRMLLSRSGKDQPDCNEGAVYYLEQVSTLQAKDFVQESSCMWVSSGRSIPGQGLAKKISSDGAKAFRCERDALFHAIGEIDGFLACLVLLPDKLVDRAAVTSVVQSHLNSRTSSPFATVIAFFNVVYSILMIGSFRSCVAEAMFHLVPNYGTFSARKHFYTSMVFASCIMYFSFRIYSREYGKWRMSSRIFWSELFDFWNMAESAPVVMASIVALVVYVSLRVSFVRAVDPYHESDVPDGIRIAVAITTGGLWLKLLAHLKMVNKQLATFVLCIIQIMTDIKWFLLVQVIVMAAFAQMYDAVVFEPGFPKEPYVHGSRDGESASQQQNHQQNQGFQTHFSDASGDIQFDSCVDEQGTGSGSTHSYALGSTQRYFMAYTVMLGAFENVDLNTMFSLLLVTLYTFLVTIVLLNVLIAIVSDSYERSMELSKTLFGRARVMFGADLDMQRDYWQLRHSHSSILTVVGRRTLYSVLLYTIVAFLESKLFEEAAETIGGPKPMIAIGWIEYLLVILGMFFCSTCVGGILRGTSSNDGSIIFRTVFSMFPSLAATRAADHLSDRIGSVIQSIVIRFIGTPDRDDNLAGRPLEQEDSFHDERQEGVRQVTELIRSQLQEEVKSSEHILKACLNHSDDMLRGEMSRTIQRLVAAMEESSLRTSVLVRESEERISEAIKSSKAGNRFLE